MKLTKPKIQTVIVENIFTRSGSGFCPDEKELASTGMSKRELEVLQLMAQGLSNEEIGSRLFVSLNTIKHILPGYSGKWMCGAGHRP